MANTIGMVRRPSIDLLTHQPHHARHRAERAKRQQRPQLGHGMQRSSGTATERDGNAARRQRLGMMKMVRMTTRLQAEDETWQEVDMVVAERRALAREENDVDLGPEFRRNRADCADRVTAAAAGGESDCGAAGAQPRHGRRCRETALGIVEDEEDDGGEGR